MKATLSMLFLLLCLDVMAAEQQIDLSTLPGRGEVQLTIYNAEDLTLVRERREVSLRRGVNPLQFSWNNTLIDPTSVELRFVVPQPGLRLVETRYPHQRPETLNWLVESATTQRVEVEISYFTSGLSWAAEYQLIEAANGEKLRFENYIRVENHSGESYDQAQVRLVVGDINLLERIAVLAKRRVTREEVAREVELSAMRYQEARKSMGAAPMMPMPMMLDEAMGRSAPPEVEKRALGEYFIYTIEGRERVADGWNNRLLNFTADDVAVRRVYRYREQEYGPRLVQLYLLDNTHEQGLGVSPLPAGQLHLYREQADGGVDLVASRHIDYVPIGDKLELLLGEDPQVSLLQRFLRTWRDDIWLEYKGGKVYRKVGDSSVRFEHDAPVAGWNEKRLLSHRLSNHSNRAVELEIRLRGEGDARLACSVKLSRHDFASAEYHLTLPAGERRDLRCLLEQAMGRNRQQEGLALSDATLPEWP